MSSWGPWRESCLAMPTARMRVIETGQGEPLTPGDASGPDLLHPRRCYIAGIGTL
jgi:hypothetical protein